MDVVVGGGGHVRMAQQPGDGGHIHAVLNGPGGEGVAHGVVFHMGQPQSGQHIPKVMAQIVRVHGPALFVIEDKVLFGRSPSEGVGKALVLKIQKIQKNIGQSQGPAGGVGFRF